MCHLSVEFFQNFPSLFHFSPSISNPNFPSSIETSRSDSGVNSRVLGMMLLCLIAYIITSQSSSLSLRHARKMRSSSSCHMNIAIDRLKIHTIVPDGDQVSSCCRSWSLVVAGRVSKDYLSILGWNFFGVGDPMCQPRSAAHSQLCLRATLA
jgi:hypothetical protein